MERFRRLGCHRDAHKGGIWCVSGAPKAANCDFVTGGADGLVCLWALNSGLEVALSANPGLRENLANSANNTDVRASTFAAWAIDAVSPVSCVASVKHHPLGVVGLAIATGATIGVSSSLDGTLRIWDVSEPNNPGRVVAGMSSNVAEVWAVAISGDGSRVVTGGSSGAIYIVDTRRALWERTLSLNPGGVLRGFGMCTSLAMYSDSLRFAVGAQHGLFCVSLAENEPAVDKEMLGHSSPVRDVAFLPGGLSCVSCGDDGLVNLYDTESSQLVIALRGHSGVVTCLSPSPCGKYLATGSSDRNVKVWDIKLREQVFSVSEHSGTVWGVAYLSKSRIVAVGDDGCISLFDSEHAETVTG